MAVSTDSKKIDALLSRRVVETIVAESLREKLRSGRRLRVKLGVDPTSPDLHLGHAVALKKLREFQDLGHQIVLIIGDYTALVGDPTGKSKTRPTLTEKEVAANAKTYLDQVGKIIDLSKIEVRRNSEWFAKMNFADIIALASRFTVARMIERDDFSRRLKEGVDIHMHELLYPMMQAHDSIMVEADVETGATEQKFNILAGRDLQRKMGRPEQDVLLGPILVGTDGVKKMSKSLGNYIGLAEPADEMYGKAMSIPDAAMWDYFTLATDVADADIAALRAACESGGMNPRDAKMRLARELVTTYHSADAAMAAEKNFRGVFQKKEVPDRMPSYKIKRGRIALSALLVTAGLASSKSEARRVITQGGVKVDGVVVNDPEFAVAVSDEKILLQKGKRHFASVKGI